MTTQYHIGPIENEQQMQQLLELLSPVFHMPVDRAPIFRKAIGDDNFRIVRCGDDIAGGLSLVHMGQFFGGKPVSMIGIVAVGIAPHYRARGAASALMIETMRELHRDQRCAISTLYPATVPVYRKAGYEVAGGYYEITLPTAAINSLDTTLDIRPIIDADIPAVEQLYRQSMHHHNGPLDRGQYMWNRVRSVRGEPAHGYIVCDNDTPVGYLYYIIQGERNNEYLLVTDLIASTPQAGKHLLALIANHRSMEEFARWFAGPSPAILLHMRELPAKIRLYSYWMLRIVDVQRALTERGYPQPITTELHIEVRDDSMNANNDTFVLYIAEGNAIVRRGGRGDLTIDIRGLSALFSGHRSVHDLIVIGLAETDTQTAAIATALFTGPEPWMVDMF